MNSVLSRKESIVTMKLSNEIVQYVAYPKKQQINAHRHAKTLRKSVDELLVRHKTFFNLILPKLNIKEQNCKDTFFTIADEIFRDGVCNWGRVICVYAFGGQLGKYCAEHNMGHIVDTIGQFVGEYVTKNLSFWIGKHGGYDALVAYLNKNSLEDMTWKCKLFTAVGTLVNIMMD